MWLNILKVACENASQAAVSQRLGVSTAMISQVLKGVYKGNMERIKRLVEGELMKMSVDCPVIGGEIPRQRCMEHQQAPFRPTSPMRVALHRGCKICPFKIGGET